MNKAVFLQICLNSVPTTIDPIGTLPTGWRPKYQVWTPWVLQPGNDFYGRAWIRVNGQIALTGASMLTSTDVSYFRFEYFSD